MAEISVEEKRWQWLVWSKDGPPHVAQRAILQVLFSYHVSTRKVFPSEGTIAEKVGLSVRSVRRHIAEIEAAGWIRREKVGNGQGWRRSVYTILFPSHLPKNKDPWLAEMERQRQQARADFREEEGWET